MNLLLAVLLLGTAAPTLPPVPNLPSSGWPLPSVAEPFARALIARVTPQQLDDTLAAHPEMLPPVFRNLGAALMSGNPEVKRYATALVRAHAGRIPRDFSERDVQLLVVYQVLDPQRYGDDEAYRKVVDAILPQSLSPTLPESLRRAAINELNRNAPIAFDTAETLAAGAGLVKTPSRARFTQLAATHAKITTGGNEPIEASIYSINSRATTPAEAKAFLAAVRAASPKRRIVVIADDDMRRALGNELHLDFVDNFSRPLTLWPRDPFSVARAADGRVVFINRPNLQPGREEDANMIRVLVDALPASLDERWKPRWATGGTSFHNGQVLLTPKAAWISIHSVEPRAREILHLDRVPVEEFATAAGAAKYLTAVQQAAKELSELYARPVRFVHDVQPDPALMTTLGGGAGFDLDSIITLLPQDGGKLVALVGDPALGRKLLKDGPGALQTTYGLSSVGVFDDSALQQFLDRCAKDLAKSGVTVARLPLLMIPSSLIADAGARPDSPYFLVTWNNVVLEGRRAEGFASGLPSGDRTARAAFKSAGYDLALFPPLSRSIVLNGGYRCASNEIR